MFLPIMIFKFTKNTLLQYLWTRLLAVVAEQRKITYTCTHPLELPCINGDIAVELTHWHRDSSFWTRGAHFLCAK